MRAHLSSLGLDTTAMSCVFAVEMFAQSQRELMALPHGGPTCVFSDMTSFIHESIRSGVIRAVAEDMLDWEDLASLIVRADAISDYAFCVKNNRKCLARRANIHCAGTPCVDWSNMAGAMREGSTGKACLAFLVWAGQRVKLQEEVIIHENVEEFPAASMFSMLLPMYIVFTLILGPDTLGWPVRRPRRISVLIHREKAPAHASFCIWRHWVQISHVHVSPCRP